MAMKKMMGVNLMVTVVLMVLVTEELPRTVEAVTCRPVAQSPYAGAIFSSSSLSRDCCQELKEQKPCLCGYLKNLNLRQYANSPGAKKVASSCGVPTPSG